MKLRLFCLLLLMAGAAVPAAVITQVERANGASGDKPPIGKFGPSTSPLPWPEGGLQTGISRALTPYVHSDRTFWWNNVPEEMIGWEHVRTFNDDKEPDALNVTYTMTTSAAATIWIAFDDRLVTSTQWLPTDAPLTPWGDGTPESRQTLVDWLTRFIAPTGTFTDTGLTLNVQEGDPGTTRTYEVFSAVLPAGSYIFASQANRNISNYVMGAVPLPLANEDFRAFNDCIRADDDQTADNVTNWTVYNGFTSTMSGPLIDFETGRQTPVTATFTWDSSKGLAVSETSGSEDGVSQPRPGTPAYEIFGDIVDFSDRIIYYGSAGWWVEVSFTGLDPEKKYTFATTAIRAKHYTDRLTLFTLTGHTSAVNNSSDGIYLKDDDRTVLVAGGNHLDTTGYVVRWDDIRVPDRGDGTGQFSVRAEAYGANYRAYPFGGFMLEQVRNSPPTVNAGDDQTIYRPLSYLTLDGTVTDDGHGVPNGFLKSTWSQLSGPASVSFVGDIHQPQVMAHFPETGVYRLQLSATDGELSASQEVTITVEPPLCPVGDLDGDCKVTPADLVLLATGWLDDGIWPAADLTGNWRVDMEELSLVAQSWQDDWTGALQVTISPAEALWAGARWKLNDGPWRSSGEVVESLAEGTYRVDYAVTPPWVRPDAQDIEIRRQETASVSAEYVIPTQTLAISEFMAVNSNVGNLRPTVSLDLSTVIDGVPVYEDWIELQNLTDEAISLEGWYLTDNADNLTKWRFPQGYSIEPRGCLVVYASRKEPEKYGYPFVDDQGHLHTNFALAREGEYLALVRPDGESIEHTYGIFPEQRGLVSYGVGSDGCVGYLTSVTRGTANTGIYDGIAADPSFSAARGFYEEPFTVYLTCATPDAQIRYTTDTSEPTAEKGRLYDPVNPIPITTTTTLRAAAYKDGHLQSNTVTHTYVFLDDVLVQATEPDTGAQGVPEGYPTTWPGGSYSGAIAGDYQMDPDIASPTGQFGHLYAATLKNDLQAVPSMSVVVPLEHFFSIPAGIYPNQSQDGTERAGSVEFIDPLTGESFHTNCAVRMQGGVGSGGTSLHRWKYDKLSMRLRFRGMYGGSLAYPVFGPTGADSFDNLVLNARSNNTWLHPDQIQRIRGDYVREQVASDLQLAMGGYAPRGRPVHVYLNGMYWGLYWLQERPDHAFAASYLGGQKDDYDVIKHGLGDVVSGSDREYIALFNISAASPDPVTAFENLNQKLDVTDFIDYLIANYYLGNTDWDNKNWYASFNRFDPQGRWRWHMWDAEHVIAAPEADVTGKNNSMAPTGLHRRWIANTEYRTLFGDRVHKHFFNDGLLTPTAFAALFANVAEQIDRAIVGESARWGDNRRPELPYTRDADWLAECNRILNDIIPGRRDVVLSQFNAKNPSWYPTVAAPVFYINSAYQHGGDVSKNDALAMLNPNASGTVYYTLEGTDPRLPGGGVHSSATAYTGALAVTARTVPVKARVLSNGVWSAMNEAIFTLGPPALLHYWHFNNLPDPTIASAAADYTILGDALIIYPGDGDGYMDTADGSDINIRLGQDAGRSLRVRNPSDTRQLLLTLPTTGYEAVQLSYAVRRTTSGAQTQIVEYRTEIGGSWQYFDQITVPDEYTLFTFDFSAIPQADNNPEFAVRILFSGEAASGTSGNNRFDNIVLDGVPLAGTNQPPQLTAPLPFTEAIEDAPVQIDLSAYFTDPDGDVLSFIAEADKPFVLEPTVAGDILTLTPLYRGESVITITADDGHNPPIETFFRVLVYPAAQTLRLGAYRFDHWSPDQPEHTFPDGTLFLQSDTSDPGLDTPLEYAYFIPHDGDDGYHDDDIPDHVGYLYRTTKRSRINGLNEDGISFINTGRQRDLGGALAAVDTTGLDGVQVHWLGGTREPNDRRYAIRLQYRLGHTGPFVDVLHEGQPVEYSVQAKDHTHAFGPIALPAEAINQPYVQLLWRYCHIDGDSGPRAQLRLDDIVIVGGPGV